MLAATSTAERLDQRNLGVSSLPKARQWLTWLEYHQEHLPATHGWQQWMRDVLIELHHGISCGARRLRNNPIWDVQGTMTDDTVSLEDRAMELLAKFNGFDARDIPERFTPFVDLLRGALRQQVRLAREIDELRASGALNVDVTVDQSVTPGMVRLVEAG